MKVLLVIIYVATPSWFPLDVSRQEGDIAVNTDLVTMRVEVHSVHSSWQSCQEALSRIGTTGYMSCVTVPDLADTRR